jgi:hypothetical protein
MDSEQDEINGLLQQGFELRRQERFQETPTEFEAALRIDSRSVEAWIPARRCGSQALSS